MISSNTDPQVQRKLMEIMRIIKESDGAVGARIIADRMKERGYQIGERGVRYHLRILDERGLTVREGYSGRTITKKGLQELEDGLIGYRVGFVSTTIDELIYNTNLDVDTGNGNVIVNTAIIDKDDFDDVMEIISAMSYKPYSMSPYVRILEENDPEFRVPEGKVGIATVCSITIDGILVRNGIPVSPRYGGLIKMMKRAPTAFSDLVLYSGTTIDPMRIFIDRKMTSILDTYETGNGKLLANIREIPASAYDQAVEVLNKAMEIDIDCLIKISEPGTPVLKAPVTPGKIGLPVYAGINSMAAVEESGIDITIQPISTITDYKKMTRL